MSKRPMLNSPFSGAPSKTVCDFIADYSHAIRCGRVGVLVCEEDGHTVFHTKEEQTRYPNGHYGDLTESVLYPQSDIDSFLDSTLVNAARETITLEQFFSRLFERYPEKPYEQGGKALLLRKARWRQAIISALESPAISLIRDWINGNFSGTPLFINEWWVGDSPAHQLKRDKAIVSPRSSVKPLYEWLTEGLDSQKETGLWPETLTPTLPILYEDNDIVVIDKPAKLASVPGVKETKNAKDELEKSVGPLYIVHRLDTDTSGVLLFAKTREAQSDYFESFRSGLALKRYRALLERTVNVSSGTIELPIATDPEDSPRQCVLPLSLGGKPSKTDFELVRTVTDSRGVKHSLVDLYPDTGRTHQLRVHCAHALGLDTPIQGDPFYGSLGLAAERDTMRMCLHAAELTITHPKNGSVIRVSSPEPF